MNSERRTRQILKWRRGRTTPSSLDDPRAARLGRGDDRLRTRPVGSSRVRIDARHLQLGAPGEGRCSATLVVTGYPREVYPGWLEPLTSYPGRVDVAVHIAPIDPVTATNRLRRQLARLESGRRSDVDHGRLRDPYAEAATEDAYDLADRVARGEGRLFTVTLTLTVHAPDPDQLDQHVAEVAALAASMLLTVHPTTFRAADGWVTALPLGIDRLRQTRTMDTDALAAAFPLASADLPTPPPTHGHISGAAPGGVLYGRNLTTPNLVFWDRFGCDNYNAVVLARSGAGKSYLVKLELLRSLYRGVDAHVIDPEDEYTRLAAAVGGAVLRPGSTGVHLNPLDLPLSRRDDGTLSAPRDAVARRALFLHTVVAVLLDEKLSATDRAVLDTAITATYGRAGILAEDPTTWTRPAPLLADLQAMLAAPGPTDRAAQESATRLAAGLAPYTEGAFRELFAGPTSTRPESHLVVWALRGLPEQLRPIATLLALDAIWAQVSNPADPWPRMVVVDEAWQLMAQPAGAAFLLRMAKSGRKHWCGLTVATQDVADLLGTDLGRAVVANSATQILLRQAPQAIDAVTTTFGLSGGERAFLTGADRGDALLSAGRYRVAFHALAAPAEHDLITTDPGFLATRSDSRQSSDHVVLLSGADRCMEEQ